MAGRRLSRIVVSATGDRHRRGLLIAGALVARCALGRSGVAGRKHEGDGATPAGRLRPVTVFYRSDRVARPVTALAATPMRSDSGWCDDPADRNYNRPVRHPYAASHERLWRDDRLYDILVVLDYNLAAPRPGAGSAIFLHLARPDFAPTEGCIAVTEMAMRRLLARIGPGTVIDIR
jgi:L,D-peptidoglycan transpeptidase YkuD (ErfK/YbiS/YcfS/YnhG family)